MILAASIASSCSKVLRCSSLTGKADEASSAIPGAGGLEEGHLPPGAGVESCQDPAKIAMIKVMTSMLAGLTRGH